MPHNPNPKYTTAAVKAASITDPEFIEIPSMKPMFAIGRTATFELIKSKRIRSVNLRREGKSKGRRLIEVASVRQYLARLMNEGGI
ncbi:MAG: hypothetical protein K8R57_02940 [Verrucomicrobia bacterium]|nr:hypothetical protein [Verrucomicrobiota bacterium]